ncbi:glycosyltransferase [candidate division KSB1 bacterium]|nr:glycosyltransferase [candidate division KSB1 bacterium]
MKIAAIIPTYNRADMVVEALRSVLAQTRPADEIIVVDDGSRDETKNRLSPFLPKIRYLHQETRGVSAARNLGIKQSHAEWLAFLDSDDLWMPEKLGQQVNYLQRFPRYRICYTDEEWRKNQKWINQKRKHRKFSGPVYEKCLPLCMISPSSVMIHRSVFEQVGMFDEKLPACEDYDLWLRICSRYPVLYVDRRLIVKRAGEWWQLSGQHSLDKYRIIALDKILRAGQLDEEKSRQTLFALQEKCRIYRIGCQRHGRHKDVQWVERVLWQYGMIEKKQNEN